jgi:hypothetical protein
MWWAQFINEDAFDFVIMADRSGEEFVALEELRGMFSPPLEKMGRFSLEPHTLKIRITGVQRRDTLLPKLVLDDFGRMLCRSVGEAYEREVDVWWFESDTALPNEDGCTHSSI